MTQTICQQWESYYDGKLDAVQLADFEVHLRNCASCQTRLEQTARIENDLLAILFLRNELEIAEETEAAIGTLEVRRSLPQPIQVELETANARCVVTEPLASASPRFSNRLRVSLATVASLAAITFSLWWFFSTRQPTGTTVQESVDESNAVIASSNESLMVESEDSRLPDLICEFTGPTIATQAITTPRFTYVQVYPQFERTEPIAETQDQFNSDPAAF